MREKTKTKESWVCDFSWRVYDHDSNRKTRKSAWSADTHDRFITSLDDVINYRTKNTKKWKRGRRSRNIIITKNYITMFYVFVAIKRDN